MRRKPQKDHPFRFKSTKQKLSAITLDTNVVEQNRLNSRSHELLHNTGAEPLARIMLFSRFQLFCERESKQMSIATTSRFTRPRARGGNSLKTNHWSEKLCPSLAWSFNGLAQDLGLDFLQHLERIIPIMLTLIDEGAVADPEILEAIFSTLAQICKQRRKYFLSNPSQLLSHTCCLRLHRSKRVRQLTSRIIGFALRTTTIDTWDAIYTGMVDDIIRSQLCIRQQKEVAAETGEIIFHAISGAAHDVHSLAVERVDWMLRHTLSSDSLHEEIQVTLMKTCMHKLLEHVKGHKVAL